jgi:ABC-2 type transport system permease protein
MRKEFLQVRRDPRLVRLIILAPVIQLLAFGYAVTTDIKHITLATRVARPTSVTRAVVDRFAHSGYFDLRDQVSDPREFRRLLDNGSALIALDLPPDFSRRLLRREPAQVQMLVDGSDSNTAGVAMGYAAGVVQRAAQDLAAEAARRAGASPGPGPPVDNRVRVWYNPDLKSVNYMVPGIVCMILTIVTVVMTGVSVVKERELGTLEQIIVTPIRPGELMLGKVAPFAAIGFADVLLILAVAEAWFRVPLRGSVALLFALSAIFLPTSLGIGLFVSTVSRTQQQASMTAFFINMPSILLSGFIFPIANMPQPIQWLSYLIPLRYFLVIVRGIFLKGVGLQVLWPQVLAMAALGAIILSLSVARYHKTLD